MSAVKNFWVFWVRYKIRHFTDPTEDKIHCDKVIKSAFFIRVGSNIWLPGAMIFFKIGSAEPDALFTGKHLQSVGVDGPGTLQRSMGNTLQHNQQAPYRGSYYNTKQA